MGLLSRVGSIAKKIFKTVTNPVKTGQNIAKKVTAPKAPVSKQVSGAYTPANQTPAQATGSNSMMTSATGSLTPLESKANQPIQQTGTTSSSLSGGDVSNGGSYIKSVGQNIKGLFTGERKSFAQRPILKTGVDENMNPTGEGSPNVGDVFTASSGIVGGFGKGLQTARAVAMGQKARKWGATFQKLEQAGVDVVEGKTLSKEVEEIAKGKEYIIERGSGAVLTKNAKTSRLAGASLFKALKGKLKNPFFTIGLITAGYFAANQVVQGRATAQWGIGEAQDMLVYAKEEAQLIREYELADEINGYYKELTNPDVIDQFKLWLPVINSNVMLNAKTTASDYKDEVLNAKIKKREEEISLAEEGNPVYGTQEWWDAKEQRDAEAEAESRRFYEMQNIEKAEQDRLNREFWAAYQEEEERMAEEERAYWLAKEGRDAARAEEEKQYWAAVRKAQEDAAGSGLGFGLF